MPRPALQKDEDVQDLASLGIGSIASPEEANSPSLDSPSLEVGIGTKTHENLDPTPISSDLDSTMQGVGEEELREDDGADPQEPAADLSLGDSSVRHRPLDSNALGTVDVHRLSTQVRRQSIKMAQKSHSSYELCAEMGKKSRTAKQFDWFAKFAKNAAEKGVKAGGDASRKVSQLRKLQNELRLEESDMELPWIHTMQADKVFGGLVALNSITMGIEMELICRRVPSAEIAGIVIENMFLLCFWIEIILRIRSSSFRMYLCSEWGPFDLFCTVLGSCDAWLIGFLVAGEEGTALGLLRVFRLLRLLKIVRSLRFFSELGRLGAVFMGAFKYLIWVFLLILVAAYMTSCIFLMGVNFDKSELLRTKWHNLLSTMFWHMTFITGDGYLEWIEEFARYPWLDCLLWTLVCVVAIVFFSQIMLNISIGLLSMKSIQDEKISSSELDSFIAESDMFKDVLHGIFSTMDNDHSGRLDLDELSRLLDSHEVQKAMRAFSIRPDFYRNHMLTVFGMTDHESSISFEDFQTQCLALTGSMNNIRPFWLQVDVLGQMMWDLTPQVSSIVTQTQALESAAANCNISSMSSTTAPLPTESTSGDDAWNPHVAEGEIEMLTVARARMEELERQQQEMMEAVVGIRQQLSNGPGENVFFSESLAVCCKQGHALVPVGTLQKALLSASYSHWTCDGKDSPEGCKFGPSGASHLSGLERFHCSRCLYDLCEHCYRFRLASSLEPW
eukprot:TRINITY_DN31095_c0_g1_i1.p1 TRINITY_DN31095_c0_g1~~TRINITY_DN31095_c0_g1_i1.p1  ORF type:complete len:730 (-),score=129.87 TRINITY_DN31095_c0_g1_i1:16-2205(-)